MAKVHKKKAIELYYSMLNVGKGITSDYLAKQCAIIAVQEIVNEFECIVNLIDDTKSYLHYWKNVLKELKKLP